MAEDAESTVARRDTAGSVRLGVLLGMVGGFLDAFTYIAHGGVFSNAQTGNVVLVGIFAARGNWPRALRQVLPLLAFVVGVFTAETMTHPRVRAWIRRPMRAALIAEIVVLVVVAFVPDDVAGFAVVVLVSYVAAVQNSTFDTLRKWPFNTVTLTGNLRTMTRSTYRALVLRGKGEGDKARSFAVVCAAFLAGAVIGALSAASWGNRAALVGAGMLAAALLLFILEEPRTHREVGQ
ncbi:MAG TPA: YoaK family protein [Pseudonocardiaceae bacterium]|jgi:uncharacterized membrane protein YoaK (UPF0700 family)|nr:YoaK family protein [Pseudonocardiaceae bacterium]